MLAMKTSLKFIAAGAALVALSGYCRAQVHYTDGGSPWNQTVETGPDKDVPGWFYNCGITGIRVELIKDVPTSLFVRYVFPRSPAFGKIKEGDFIIGAGGKLFETPHQNGYGMEVFGAEGPILDFAKALREAQSTQGAGKLEVSVFRKEKSKSFKLNVGTKRGEFFEENVRDEMLEELLDSLVSLQGKDGSWGIPSFDTFAALALMSSDKESHKSAMLKNVKFHAKNTSKQDESSLINWRYMAAAIVLSEYYLRSEEKWVLKELQQIYEFLIDSQYVSKKQINPKSKESHPSSYPQNDMDSYGGWGHNPGFEGYGPIAMLTAQGALAFSLMSLCGIEVNPERHMAAYDFLERASGKNFYVWYADESAGDENWADMGRTGATAIAFAMSPFEGHIGKADMYAKIIGQHPESFPDTHASPIMGMALGALGAYCHKQSFNALIEANHWWFTMAQCTDGSFYYQPNRDNAGYGYTSRAHVSAVVAFILSLSSDSLALTRLPERNAVSTE
jgi:hypothetical protein